jgi:hypothetical protein
MSHLGCYLTAAGTKFDVDSFLKRSTLQPDSVFYRGQPLKAPKGKVRRTSGSSVTVIETRVFGELSPQIPKALRFVRQEQRELARLARFPGVTDLRLVFPCCRDEGTYGCERFPAELLTLAGSRRIDIELSFYPGGPG